MFQAGDIKQASEDAQGFSKQMTSLDLILINVSSSIASLQNPS